jgi:hypothetical protein
MKTEWWIYGRLYDEDCIDITKDIFIRSYSTKEEADQFIKDNQYNEKLGYLWTYTSKEIITKSEL